MLFAVKGHCHRVGQSFCKICAAIQRFIHKLLLKNIKLPCKVGVRVGKEKVAVYFVKSVGTTGKMLA